ncbi:hypothetical protein [Pedosphaera parvula]|nr:hypothetical protein [Pedosphaera parvula]
MPNQPLDVQSQYTRRINDAQAARAKLAVAGETLDSVLRIQTGVVFCAALGIILWLIFHGYSTIVCFLVGLGSLFQVVVFYFLSGFVRALTQTQVETLRSSLSCMCLSAGIPDPELPTDESEDEGSK